jgi:hypothetical protein
MFDAHAFHQLADAAERFERLDLREHRIQTLRRQHERATLDELLVELFTRERVARAPRYRSSAG